MMTQAMALVAAFQGAVDLGRDGIGSSFPSAPGYHGVWGLFGPQGGLVRFNTPVPGTFTSFKPGTEMAPTQLGDT